MSALHVNNQIVSHTEHSLCTSSTILKFEYHFTRRNRLCLQTRGASRRFRESLLSRESNKYYSLVCVCVRACG